MDRMTWDDDASGEREVARLWTIHEVARASGITSRTLRHYHAIGLLEPTQTADNGYRLYGADALVRLQRILVLRELGLGLPAIARVLEEPGDLAESLRSHRTALEREGERLARRIASVGRTITAIERGEDPMTRDMFDGFDHTRYEDEVVERWGAEAYSSSDAWWRGMSTEDRMQWGERSRALAEDWIAAWKSGLDPAGPEAGRLAARHVAWLGTIPGTPGAGGARVKEYITGLGELYVADERFAANYGGPEGATFVRDALTAYADVHL